jgi:hypothetical protein
MVVVLHGGIFVDHRTVQTLGRQGQANEAACLEDPSVPLVLDEIAIRIERDPVWFPRNLVHRVYQWLEEMLQLV